MLADLDLLLTTVYCAADDLLPRRAVNARRRVTDAEIVTLAVAQALLDISSDRAFLRLAARSLIGLFFAASAPGCLLEAAHASGRADRSADGGVRAR
jgi:hypothetical protein